MATKKKETEEIKDIEQNQSDKKTVKKTAKAKKTDADVKRIQKRTSLTFSTICLTGNRPKISPSRRSPRKKIS